MSALDGLFGLKRVFLNGVKQNFSQAFNLLGGWTITEAKDADGKPMLNITPPAAGVGDVVGPAVAVADRIATYNGTTGKLIKDGGTTIATLTGADATNAAAAATAQTTANSALARDMFAITGAANDIAGSHVGKVGTVSHTATTTYTVRLNSGVAIAAMSEITLIAIGVGQLVIAAEGGVTIRTAETLKARKQYSWVTLKKDKTTGDLWWLTGDLELA